MYKLSMIDIRVDFRPIQLADIKATAGTPSENKSFLSETENPVEQLEAEDVFGCLVQLADAALENLALVNLSVVLPLRNHQQGFRKPLGIEVLGNHKGVADMRLDDVLFLAPIFRDVAVGAANLDIWKHRTKSLHQCLAHDTHESCVSRRASSAATSRQLDFPCVICLVAVLAECDQIVWRIASDFAALQMMDTKFHGFLLRAMSSAILAGIAITMEHVLAGVVYVVHLAELVVRADRKRFSRFHRFQTLQIEFRCLDADSCQRKQPCGKPDALDVVPDLDFDRWREPAHVLGMHTVLEPSSTVSRRPIPAAPAQFTPIRHKPHDIIARTEFGSKQLLLLRSCRQSYIPRSSIHAERNILRKAMRYSEKLDGERCPSNNPCLSRLEQEPHLAVVFRRHDRLSILRYDVDQGAASFLFPAAYQSRQPERMLRKLSVANVLRRFSCRPHRPFPAGLLTTIRRASDSNSRPTVPIHSPQT